MRIKTVIVLAALLCACRRREAPVVPAGSPRLVSLAPSITETVCAVGAGDCLVGRTTACNYPPDIVQRVPAVGGFGMPSLELLAAVKPTHVLDVDLEDEGLAALIEALGVQRQRVRARGLEDIPTMILQVGQIARRENAARELADAISRRLEALHTTTDSSKRRPSVYAEIWHDPLTTVGGGTFLSDLIRLAGGRNMTDDVTLDYFALSPEQVLAGNPDVILCLYMSQSAGAAERVKQRPGWTQICAVRSDAVFDGLNQDVLLRPGPRVLEGIDMLRACFSAASQKPREEEGVQP